MTARAARWTPVLLAVLVLPVVVLAPPAAVAAEPGVITTLAGGPGSGPALSVGQDPLFVRVVGQSVLVADAAHQVLRRIDLGTGEETVVAGTGGEVEPKAPGRPPLVTPDDGGPAQLAEFFRVSAFAVAPDGTTYVVDERRIRRIASDGTITTAVGTGARRSAAQAGDTPVRDATLGPVTGVAVDAGGRLWFAEGAVDETGGTIRRLDPDGVVRLVVGPRTRDDGAPDQPYQVQDARALFFEPDGSLVYLDSNRYAATLVRYADGGVRRGTYVNEAIVDAVPAGGGDVLLAARGRLLRVTPDGTVTDVPGTGPSLRFHGEYVSADLLPDGRPVMARSQTFAVTTLGADGKEVALAGDGSAGAAGDGGPATQSQLGRATSIARMPDGSLLVADETAHRVRRITTDGRMLTFAGTGSPTNSGDGGPASGAALNAPGAVEVAPDGSVLVAVRNANNASVLRRVSPLGTISTWAGGGNTDGRGSADALDASLFDVQALEVAPDGRVFVATGCNVFVFAPGATPDRGGAWGTYAGGDPYVECGDSGDGGPARSARFRQVSGLALSGAGDLYVVDRDSSRVRRIDPGGTVHAFAGASYRRGFDESFSGDGGSAVAAHLNSPRGVAVEPDGSVLVADTNNYRVRRVNPSGVIDTVAGGSYLGPPGDGGPAVGAGLRSPRDVEAGDGGRFVIAESHDFSLAYGYGRHRVRLVTPGAPSEPTPSSSAAPVRPVQPLPPARLLDTRDGTGGISGRLVDGRTASFPVLGRGGVPSSGVRAVVLNATVTSPGSGGHLTVFPGGQAAPAASTLNYAVGQTVANLVVVPVGADGRVAVRASAGRPHALADVVGYLAATSTSDVDPLTPSRVLDSRTGSGGVEGRLVAGRTYGFGVLGRGGVPSSGVRAVLLNTAVVGPTGTGHLTVFPAGQPVPRASNLNHVAGQAAANLVLVPVGTDGRVSLRSSGGSPFVLADVVGYLAEAPGATTHPLTPARVLDTRDGTGGTSSRLAPRQPVTVVVAGRGGVPATGVRAVLLSVAALGAGSAGHLTVYPAGQQPPLASTLNFPASRTVPNLVLVPVDSQGRVSLVANAGSPHVLADVVGYLSD